MGNSSRKGLQAGDGRAASPRSTPPPPAAHIQLSLHDVVYPANDVTQPDPDVLRALREALNSDPEGFLLDNLLMAVQYFKNYEEEVAELRRAFDARGTPLSADGPCATTPGTPPRGRALHRVLQPDGLVQASARHVRWRPRPSEPDRLLAPQRRIVVDETIRLHCVGSTTRATAATPPCPTATHYHLVMETGPKPGHIKLRQVGQSCDGDFREDHEDLREDLSEHLVEDDVHLHLPSRTDRTPSPTSSVKSLPSLLSLEGARRLRHGPRSVDSVITSEGSRSPSSLKSLSISDLSASSNGRSRKLSARLMPLDEFRPNYGAGADGDVMPEECFQPVMVQRRPVGCHQDDDDEDVAPEALELRVQSYLLAVPFFARFADAFHDTLAAAMGFPRESVVLATVRGAGGPAAIQCEEQLDDVPALGLALGQAVRVLQCEVFPALALPGWPRAAAEWVYRERGSWPPRSAVRHAYSLGGVAVAAGSSDLSGLQWTLAFPGAEQLLELHLPADHAHTYLTLLALRHCVPGLTANHLRAGFLRLCERAQADRDRDNQPPRPWSPGAALRSALAIMYRALQRRQLPDYFVSDRNLLAEVATSQVRQAQERVFRLREFTLPSVLRTWRRLAYVREDDFYPRLDLAKLVAILNGSAAESHALEQGRDEHRDDEHADDAEWIDSFRRNFQGDKSRVAVRVRPAKAAPITPDSIKLGTATQERRERTVSVLKLFSEHFIKMAEASNKFNALQQARHYLRHSLHLLILLEQDYNCPNDAKPLFARLIETNA